MKRLILICAASALALGGAMPAIAQQTVPVIEAGHTLLTINAQGSSTRTPDQANFSAGVTTRGVSASEAMTANSRQMQQVIAALKRSGIADKDIQTSTLNLNPVWSQPKRQPDGSYDEAGRKIVAYEANNTVSVRARKLDEMGKVIDALVGAGANQVNGPSFALSQPEAAEDEARVAAMEKARARAQLYATAAGLKVARIVSISESGGYAQPMPVMYAKATMAAEAAPAPPVAAGELETTINVTVQFELAP